MNRVTDCINKGLLVPFFWGGGGGRGGGGGGSGGMPPQRSVKFQSPTMQFSLFWGLN